MKSKTSSTQPKILTGVVVSRQPARLPDGTSKTAVVEVKRLIKHRQYGKWFRRSKKYLVHDETGRAAVGDRVRIQETRPLSRRKHFKIIL